MEAPQSQQYEVVSNRPVRLEVEATEKSSGVLILLLRPSCWAKPKWSSLSISGGVSPKSPSRVSRVVLQRAERICRGAVSSYFHFGKMLSSKETDRESPSRPDTSSRAWAFNVGPHHISRIGPDTSRAWAYNAGPHHISSPKAAGGKRWEADHLLCILASIVSDALIDVNRRAGLRITDDTLKATGTTAAQGRVRLSKVYCAIDHHS